MARYVEIINRAKKYAKRRARGNDLIEPEFAEIWLDGYGAGCEAKMARRLKAAFEAGRRAANPTNEG